MALFLCRAFIFGMSKEYQFRKGINVLPIWYGGHACKKLACLTAEVWEVAECLIGDKNGFY